MLLRIPALLNRDQLIAIREELAKAKFVEGKVSAGGAARRVKNNEELERHAAQLDTLNTIVMENLVRHPVYRNGALPLRVAVPYYARYAAGMAYGDHVDDPIMGADGKLYRSDIAITIFLNDPEDYDGGELVVNTPFGGNEVKLPAGDAIMYPASSVHHVNEIRRGLRLVAVTWVQSLVRDPAKREILYDLNLAREKLLKVSPEVEETTRVNSAYINLVRMWGDI